LKLEGSSMIHLSMRIFHNLDAFGSTRELDRVSSVQKQMSRNWRLGRWFELFHQRNKERARFRWGSVRSILILELLKKGTIRGLL
jgi:hypothetical protein